QPTTVDFSTLPSAVAARFPTSPCQRTTRSESAPTHPCRGDPTIARPPATAPPTCGPTVPARPTRRHDTALRSTGGVPSRPAPYPSNPSRWHEVAVRTRSRVKIGRASRRERESRQGEGTTQEAYQTTSEE